MVHVVLAALFASSCTFLLGGGDDGSGEPSDAAPTEDAPTEDANTAPPCLPVTLFADPFIDPVPSTFWTQLGSAQQDGGFLRADGSPTGFNGLQSRETHDLSQHELSFAVLSELTVDSNKAALTVLKLGPAETRVIEVIGPVIQARDLTDVLAMTTLDRTQTRYMRMRSTDTRLFFESSPDGRLYEAFYEEPMTMALTSVKPALGATTTDLDPGHATFSDFAIRGRPGSGWCTADKLADDFADPELPIWHPIERGAGNLDASDQLELSIPVGASGIAGVESRGRYNLDGFTIDIELDKVPAEDNIAAVIEIRDSSLRAAQLRIENGVLSYTTSSGTTGSVDYNLGEHRTLRFTGDGSDLTLRTVNTDGVAATRVVDADFVELLAVELVIYLQATAPVTDVDGALLRVTRVGPPGP